MVIERVSYRRNHRLHHDEGGGAVALQYRFPFLIFWHISTSLSSVSGLWKEFATIVFIPNKELHIAFCWRPSEDLPVVFLSSKVTTLFEKITAFFLQTYNICLLNVELKATFLPSVLPKRHNSPDSVGVGDVCDFHCFITKMEQQRWMSGASMRS